MLLKTRILNPKKVFKNKRVAVIGAADSAFEKELGDFINGFDIIIRVNKAPYSWSPSKAKYIGNRTDILFHSFYENPDTGGGPMDFDLYKKQGVKYVVNPNSGTEGLKTHMIYYKRNLNDRTTYLLDQKTYYSLKREMNGWIPTVGYSALYSVLISACKEVYLTGFTFFKTPYANDYREQLENMDLNKKHINDQALHNPDLEFELFKKELNKTNCKSVKLDNRLSQLINMES